MKSKFIVPLMVAPMLLTSCGTQSFVGKYVFMMGKPNETHIGIVLELKEEDYADDPSKGKAFTLALDSNFEKKDSSKSLNRTTFNDEGGEGEGEGGEGEGDDDVIPSGIFDKDFSLSGYYSVGDTKDKDGYYSLCLGAQLIEAEGALGSFLPQEIVQDIIVASVSKTAVQASIPVSLADLVFQIYWYGWDLEVTDTSISIRKVSGENHPHGSHPTTDDVERINKVFPEEHLGLEFRDFNCLTMGLTKEDAKKGR